jgi:hypothetical protein
MKKNEYPNRGHLVSDYFVDGISRVYEHEENILMVLESPTGIETPNSIIKNECVRIIIPKSQFHKFYESIVTIRESLDFKESINVEEVKTPTKDETFLGSAFNVSN